MTAAIRIAFLMAALLGATPAFAQAPVPAGDQAVVATECPIYLYPDATPHTAADAADRARR